MDYRSENPFMQFFELEKKYQLFDLEFHGTAFWQLVRVNILKSIKLYGSSVPNKKPERNYFLLIKGTFMESIRQKHRITSIPQARLLRIRPCITVNKNGAPEDHQYDYLKLPEEVKTLDLYALGDYTSVHECAQYNMAVPEMALIIWKIRRKLWNPMKLGEDQRRTLISFINEVNQIYQTELCLSQIEYLIFYCIKSFSLYVKWYHRIYQQSCPKAILVYPHYDEHMFSAVSAARRLGIKSIEIQHGRINSHEAYYYSDNTNTGKYSTDYFFVYGQWWEKQIRMPVQTKILVTGNVYLETQAKKYQPIKNTIKEILAFSGPETGAELSQFIMNCMPYIRNSNRKVVFKLHPNECQIWRKAYPWLIAEDRLQIIEDRTKSIFELLATADYIIGINSTTLFEATLYSGKKIFVLNRCDIAAMEPLIRLGAAQCVNTEQEFCEAISDTSDISLQGNKAFRSLLWEPDASEKTVQALLEITEVICSQEEKTE